MSEEENQQELNEVVEGLDVEEARAAILTLAGKLNTLEKIISANADNQVLMSSEYQGSKIGFLS